MDLPKFMECAVVLSNFNACCEFFSWAASGIIMAKRYLRNTPQLPGEQNAVAQHRIQEDIEKLRDGLWKLKTTMPKMHDLIDQVEWQSHKKDVVLLPDIKDAVYDAEDLLDEFDYYELKLKVEWSKKLGQDHMRDNFLEFFDSVQPNDYIIKVNAIQAKLDHVHRQSMYMGLHQVPPKFDKLVQPETCSFPDEQPIFVREKELKKLVKMLGVRAQKSGQKRGRTESIARITELPVLAIVGMGGVGKTTMAQKICNDPKVKQHFDCIIWTYVSDNFDIKRLTKEIIEHLGKVTTSNNLDVLMRKLESYVKSKKFLLVLDDMCDDILKDDGAEWKRFCAPLKNGAEGSRILVTAISLEIGKLVGPMNQYELKGLEGAVFWDFFKLCAFGSMSSCNNRESLESIGKRILPKLKGSSLAAKTIGRLLRMDLSTSHWENIVESEFWQLEQTEIDILPALRLSYMYLPQKLKRCFSICAMYPKDHKFEKGLLADIWIAQGYVVEPQEGLLCFHALANRSFFQRASPHRGKYVIHDLMHDTVQLVSKDECFIIKHASDLDKVPSNVRHLSIFANGNVECSELKRICNNKKVRSLVCDESYSRPKDFAAVIDCWFKELLKIRVLSFKLSKVRQLPESIGNSKHLRYLCLLGGSTFSTLPSAVGRLHHLKTIDAKGCTFSMFPPGFSDVINLQKIKSKVFTYKKDHSDKLFLEWLRTDNCPTTEMMTNQMEALPHWNLQHLHVSRYQGQSGPSWLRPNLLPRLRSLKFRSCSEMKSIPYFVPLEASPDNTAGSENLNRLEELAIESCGQINWQGSVVLPTSLRKLQLASPGYFMDHFVSCFRDLTSLTYLKIQYCGSLTSIPLHIWISNIPSLEELYIGSCQNLTSIGFSGASSSSSGVTGFSSLAKIEIYHCNKLLSLDEFLTPGYLPAVKTIVVYGCLELASLSIHGLDGLQLQELKITDCPKLDGQSLVMLPSSLKILRLNGCDSIESIDLDNPALDELSIWYCGKLRYITRGATAVAKIKRLDINNPSSICTAEDGPEETESGH